MRKTIYLMLLLSTLSFALKIDELEFGKVVGQNNKVEKIFNLTNNDIEDKIYRISIEGDKNIKVTPTLLNLSPQQNKKFKVEVTAKNSKGNYDYFLVIKEVRQKRLKKGVALNKVVKIKQSYKIK